MSQTTFYGSFSCDTLSFRHFILPRLPVSESLRSSAGKELPMDQYFYSFREVLFNDIEEGVRVKIVDIPNVELRYMEFAPETTIPIHTHSSCRMDSIFLTWFKCTFIFKRCWND